MDDNIPTSPSWKRQIHANKIVCDALGCMNEATERVNIDAGKLGTFSLRVCSICVPKFEGKNQN